MSEKRLGRGLEALLGPAVTREAAQAQGALRDLPVAQIRPNPFQPRTTFDEQELSDLADSIAASGLLQPVVVRSKDGGFELIAGERRWRAVQRLGWQHVPAVVKEVDDRTLLTLALIENLQRDDLSPIDEALGFQRLMDEFGVPQAEVARLVGKDRSTVSNLLRLLKLPEPVRALVHAKQLSEGHARALLGLQHDAAITKLAHDAVAAGWSVREVEERVRGDAPATRRKRPGGAAPAPTAQSADARRIEDALRRRLGTDVKLTAKRKGRGLLTIAYYSNDDLARLLEVILGQPFDG